MSLSTLLALVAYIRKTIIYAVGVAGVAVSGLNLHGNVRLYAVIGIAVVVGVLHWRVPNADKEVATLAEGGVGFLQPLEQTVAKDLSGLTSGAGVSAGATQTLVDTITQAAASDPAPSMPPAAPSA